MTSPDPHEPSMPAEATRNLFLWASGFGIGALLVLGGFIVLIGIGTLGRDPASTPTAQTAAHAPATPGAAPQPAPQTPPSAETTGQSAQPAKPAPQPETTGQAPKADAPLQPQVPKPGANRS
jgi:cell division septation protein DedD